MEISLDPEMLPHVQIDRGAIKFLLAVSLPAGRCRLPEANHELWLPN